MKVSLLGNPQIIMNNPYSKHNYFGWPTVTRLQNGKIAVAASGFRLDHVCPFGKTVISFSENEGESYSLPTPVIDTPLDDRDGGILAFGQKNVIVTSFNNTVDFQRSCSDDKYINSYLDTVTPDEQEKYLGVTFRISTDCGVTFGEIMKSPVTSPHGPIELKDGSLLWVGRTFSPKDAKMPDTDCIKAYKMHADGSMEYLGKVNNIKVSNADALLCEPSAIELDDGSLLAHIRLEEASGAPLFTIYQTKSVDGGKTWSAPVQILPRMGGAPPHLFKHSSGMLICTYGYREKPYGIKAMFSLDNGNTWDTGYDIYINGISSDIGYPSTIQLKDGSLLTVFYAKTEKNGPAVIMQQKWKVEAD